MHSQNRNTKRIRSFVVLVVQDIVDEVMQGDDELVGQLLAPFGLELGETLLQQ